MLGGSNKKHKCTFEKSFKCKGNKELANGLSKLFSLKSELKKELKIVNKIKKNVNIQNQSSFMNTLIGYCDITKKELLARNQEVKECMESKKRLRYQLVYKYTGETLSDILKTDIDDKIVSVCLHGFRSLAKGLKQLNDSDILILDIKSENILMKDGGQDLIFNEFGKAASRETIYDFEMTSKMEKRRYQTEDIEDFFKNVDFFKISHKNTPPELKTYYLIVNFVLTNLLKNNYSNDDYYYRNDYQRNNEKSIKSVIKKLRNHLLDKVTEKEESWNVSELVSLYSKTNQYNNMKDANKELRIKNINDMITDLFESELSEEDDKTTDHMSILNIVVKKINTILSKHAGKIDVYGFGIVLLEFYIACLTNNLTIPNRKDLLRIIKKTTRPNVFDRWDSDTLVVEFDKYMNSENTDEDDDITPYLVMMSSDSTSGGSKSKRLNSKNRNDLNDLTKEIKAGSIGFYSCLKYKKQVLVDFAKKNMSFVNTTSIAKKPLCELIRAFSKLQKK